MKPQQELPELRRIFDEQISVCEITSPLASFDSTANSNDCREFMRENQFDVIGVRIGGIIVGYVSYEKLKKPDGILADFVQKFRTEEVVDSNAPLLSCLRELVHKDRIFVRSFGHVAGLVTRADVLRPPVRLWLFGVFTLMEMELAELFRSNLSVDIFKNLLSKKQAKSAEYHFNNRRIRNVHIDLLDCVAFEGKWDVLMKVNGVVSLLEFENLAAAKHVSNKFTHLRDDLAHPQRYFDDWKTLASIAELLERLVDRLSASTLKTAVRKLAEKSEN